MPSCGDRIKPHLSTLEVHFATGCEDFSVSVARAARKKDIDIGIGASGSLDVACVHFDLYIAGRAVLNF